MAMGTCGASSGAIFSALVAGALALTGTAVPAAAQQEDADAEYVCQVETGDGYDFRYVLHYYYSGALTLYTSDRYDTREVGEMELIASDFERGDLFELDERFWVFVTTDKAVVSSTRGSWFCERA